MAVSTGIQPASAETRRDKSYLYPFILVTCLFFLWGFSYGLLDVLNRHFQETMGVSKAKSTLLQGAYFGAYFLVALPAGLFMTRWGYKRGIVLGLTLFAVGAFLFYGFAAIDVPNDVKFNYFLAAFLVLASGLTFLETAANPYASILGKPELSEFRLNLSQAFNGVGSFIGPLVGGYLFFNNDSKGSSLDTVQLVYVVIGIVVTLFAILIGRTHLPEIKESRLVSDVEQDIKPLFAHRHFIGAVVTQFFYVAAQVGIAALFINYCTEADGSISNQQAANLLGTSLLLFTIGRFTGALLMKKIAPNKLLTFYRSSMYCCVYRGFCQQYAFGICTHGSIFLYVHHVSYHFCIGGKRSGTSYEAGFFVFGNGNCRRRFMPYFMGLLATPVTANAYIIPLACFVIVAWFGWRGYKTH